MIKIEKENKTTLVCQLKLSKQQEIKRNVRAKIQLMGFSQKEENELIKKAMNSKVCDLENTIEIKYI